jgi:MFS family permease
MNSILSKERITASAGFNRWLIPPAALAIHLSIGQVYAFSVFNEPLTRIIGVSESAPADWTLTTLGWIFSIAIAVLGLTAAFAGRWVERVGPRQTMVVAAFAWGGGFLVSALGVWLHSIWLLYLGYGVFGGIGLGLAYISPVKTLIRWFPDRPGMATGMAIMGFGGGAMVGSPLAVNLMGTFSTPDSVGVAATFTTMGILYFCLMMFGAIIVRVPPPGWTPTGFDADRQTRSKLQTRGHVHVETCMKTPQFWLIWIVLCMNVTAGIGVLGQASVMSQEMVGISASAAAGFVGLLSLFNMGGRFIWSSISDYIGRKATYSIFLFLGIVFYISIPMIAESGIVWLFVLCYLIIISFYGGGFATVPAYLRDLFGTAHVGAIHGRLLTAWAVAGVLGPVLINYLREYQIQNGVAPADAYSLTMYIMAALLAIGLVANLAIRRTHDRHLMSKTELSYE